MQVLKEHPQGLSLAQLPQFLKRKLDFELNLLSLGFSKLKDLILKMDQVKMELHSQNHPFARLLTAEELKK